MDEAQQVRQREGVAPTGSMLRRLRRTLRPYFDTRRGRTFQALFPNEAVRTILDVGGRPATWDRLGYDGDITVLNLNLPREQPKEGTRCRLVLGDARRLQLQDASVDLAYSNAVIEHVGDWPEQLQMAQELRRVGRSVWCQTPNRWFPIEPHLVGPFIHWLPLRFRGWFLVRYLTTWGWTHRPSRQQAREFVASIRLLSRREMRQAFPDCEIRTERVAFVLVKSFIAVRR